MFALGVRRQLSRLSTAPPPIIHRLSRRSQLHTTPRSAQYIPTFTTTKSQPFAPINPYTLPKPPPSSGSHGHPLPPPRPPRLRLRKTLTRISLLTALSLTIYLLDTYLNYSALTRSLRTLRTALLISLDYKLNFTPLKSPEQLSALHARNADRMVALCLTNGGLYQKIGQALAMQSALLPAEFQAKFARFFSDTPQAGRAQIEKVLRAEFPHLADPVNELFVPGTFTARAMGSASVAQVHKAQLADGSGAWVAVKIQKPGISRQVGWDLGVFRLVMGVFSERLFGLPLGFVVPYICERLESETDFRVERGNSLRMRELVQAGLDGGRVPGRAGGWLMGGGWGGEEARVYVPRVYEELCTRRVLVAEWIDGVPLSHARKEGGFEKLGVSPAVVMHALIQLFARQMFWWGDVHCDPHPGNILIRKIPSGTSSFSSTPPPPGSPRTVTEVVLLDHGLYIHLPPALRQQYARLWTALMSLDTLTVAEITAAWGFGNPEMLAGMTMLRPYKGNLGFDADILGPGGEAGEEGKEGKEEARGLTAYERQLRMKEAIRTALRNEEMVPRELVFLGRCMRILQANNQLLLSPANRLNLLSLSASASLLPGNPNFFTPSTTPPTPPTNPTTTTPTPTTLTRPPPSAFSASLSALLKSYLHHLVFRITLFLLDVGFWVTRVRMAVLGRGVGGGGGGFEDEIEERMRRVAREEWGLEIGGGVFRG